MADDSAIIKVLDEAYGLAGVRLKRVLRGVATVNYVADAGGRPTFVKVYLPGTNLASERGAIELSEFTAAGGVPTAAVVRSARRELIHQDERVALSVWEFVPADPPGEEGLSEGQMTTIGPVLGRLHRILSTHPASPARPFGVVPLCDMDRATRKIERVLKVLAAGTALDKDFAMWAVEVLRSRLALIPRLRTMLHQMPPLTGQVVHGDLAAPNVLFRGEQVAAVIDFCSPSMRAVAWEISRLSCDPRTVLRGDEWMRGLCCLVAAYRAEHPDLPSYDLIGSVRAWVCYSGVSAYPFDDLADGRALLPLQLQRYAVDRHHALMAVMDRLDDIEDALREVVA